MIASAPSTPSRHIAGLDLVRFAAAMMVLFFHLALSSWSEPRHALQVLGLDPFLSPLWPVTWFGFIGVQIFFVISGFVIAFSAERASPFAFLRERIVRLAPALWLTAAGSLLIYLGFRLAPPGQAVAMFVKEAVFWPVAPWLDEVVWTLHVEVAFYALVFALLCLRRFAWITGLAAALAVLSLAFHLLRTGLGCLNLTSAAGCPVSGPWARLATLTLLEHGAYFALGIFLWAWLIKGEGRRHLWWAALTAPAALLQIAQGAAYARISSWFGAPDAPLYQPTLLMGTVWALAVAALAASIKGADRLSAALGPRGGRIARQAGLATYPLYLIHYTWTAPLIRLALEAGLPAPLAIGFGMVAIVALAFLIARFLEPPLQRALRARLAAAGEALQSRPGRLAFLFAQPADDRPSRGARS